MPSREEPCGQTHSHTEMALPCSVVGMVERVPGGGMVSLEHTHTWGLSSRVVQPTRRAGCGVAHWHTGLVSAQLGEAVATGQVKQVCFL